MKVRLAKRYAQALFQAAAEQQAVHKVEDELAIIEQIFADPAVHGFFSNPGVASADKKDTIARVFGPYFSGFTQNFLCYMAEKRRTNVLPEVITAYRDLVKQAENIVTVEVVTATALAEQDQTALTARLAEVTGKTIELSNCVDKRILGGLIIHIGDKRIDNSVRAKLEKMKNQLLSKSLRK
jgi:F-type H+-transporting ATPase subunit delta